MEYTYCKQWFRAKKRPIDIWDEDAARAAHEERRPYTVLAGAADHPICFVELNGDYIGVGFFDDALREYLSYQFQGREPGKLFLTMATHREFQGDSDLVASGTTYVFQQDGTVDAEDEDFLAATKSTRQTEADVSGNWEPYPTFGEYSSIIRVERGAGSSAT